MNTSKFTAILGLQWGDEGKGKLVDALAGEVDIVARFGGGANAGHSIHVDGKKYVTHQVPSGALYPHTTNVIGNGCVVHLPSLAKEIAELEEGGMPIRERVFVSSRAPLLLDAHKLIDAKKEELRGGANLGTTKSGIGPAYADKVSRDTLRVGELRDFALFEARLRAHLAELAELYSIEIDVDTEVASYKAFAANIADRIIDTAAVLYSALADDKKLLIEGAQAALLDIDHGTYPFVTSSNTTIGGVFAGLGIGPQREMEIIGVAKAYTTRVGAGPFPTELDDETGEKLREIGHEFGATTGRPRRCGWLDLVATRYSARLNGCTAINLTKLDCLNDFAEIKVCVAYELDGERIETLPSTAAELERLVPVYGTLSGWQSDTSEIRKISDLPEAAQVFVKYIEDYCSVPVKWVGVGMERTALAA